MVPAISMVRSLRKKQLKVRVYPAVHTLTAISVAAAIPPTAGIPPVRAVTANPQPTITIPELTPFLRANQFPMSPQSLPRLPPPNPVSKPHRPVTTLPQQLPPPSQQQAPPPASLPWPPALLPATRKRPVPKAVTTIPSRLTKSALQRVTTDTPAIQVAAIRLAPTMATILPFLPEKPVKLFTPAPV